MASFHSETQLIIQRSSIWKMKMNSHRWGKSSHGESTWPKSCTAEVMYRVIESKDQKGTARSSSPVPCHGQEVIGLI
ncbi:hypothetical protein Y1Q_0009531 [Alligator mississippiensis]|uniref:Uncharacterized protein n=1 Tax=Alligator mississippiensis TaxID=8496 RepID=A0A151NUF9_ALLMI|nr:hypothetical protein Y1Q_0009531 [Alligator mississippiensis]